MEKKLRALVFGLGKNVPPTATASEILDLAQDACWNHKARAKLHRQIRLEKVIVQAYHNACLLNQRQETSVLSYLIEALQEECEKRRTFSERIMPTVRTEVTQVLKQAGVSFLFIKGSSLEGYPHGYSRQMNDLDIIVEGWDDLFVATEALEAQGYNHLEAQQCPWIMQVSSRKSKAQMSGHLFLTRYEGEHYVELDLRSSPFVISTTGVLENDIWERARAQRSTVPTSEDKLLILVAHAANHGFFLIKDFNDVYALLNRHGDTFDWEYFCRWIRQSTLSYAAYYVLERVKLEYEKECVPQQVLDTLRQSEETLCAKAIALTSRSSKEHRWRRWIERIMYSLHTLAFEQANHGLASGLRKVIEYLAWSFRFSILQGSIGDYSIVQRLLHSSKNQLFPSPRRGQEILIVPAVKVCDNLSQEQLAMCVRIAPAALQTAGPHDRENGRLEVKPVGQSTLFLRLGAAEAILTPVDLFIPTCDAVFTDSDIAALEALTEALLNVCTQA